jgi:uncharacterized delta-60 repeat protein
MRSQWLLSLAAWLVFSLVAVLPAAAVSRLDGSFGLNGRVAVELGVRNSAHAVLVQPDGKILIAGSSSRGLARNMSLLRFNRDGSLDATFGRDGSVITSVAIGDDEILALGLFADGRIVAAGYSHNGADRDFALVCYLPDGSLDRSFGEEGVVITPVGSGNEEITAVQVNRDDMITVAGGVEGTTGRVLATARYFSDGVPDSGYGEQGISLIGVGADTAAEGLLERGDGTLVVSGSYELEGKSALMLVGLTPDGVIDPTFGEGGVAVADLPDTVSEGYRLAEDSDGRLYLAGSVGKAGERDAALFRFTRSGRPDDEFGDSGVLVTRMSAEDDLLYDVVAGRSGVVAGGYTTDAGTRQFLLASYGHSGSRVETTGGELPVLGQDSDAMMPVQEVRTTGDTRVQIRKLRVSSSLSDGSAALTPPATSPPRGRLVAFGQQLGRFLVRPALAADSGAATVAEAAATAPRVRTTTTTFSKGESVSYALATDADGKVILVGTADGAEASSMVAARYAADPEDLYADTAGYTSGAIRTREPGDVTRATAVTGGEILPAFGRAVSKRGVVFSITDTPVYSGGDGADGDTDDGTDDGTDNGDGTDDGTNDGTDDGTGDTDLSPKITNETAQTFSGGTATLKVRTNVASTCSYSASSTETYSAMRDMDTTDGLAHKATVGIKTIGTHTRLVRCSSTASGAENTTATPITFTRIVAASSARTFDRLTGLFVAEAVAATATSGSSTGNAATTSIFGAAGEDSEEQWAEEGETENGSGYGRFSARLENLKPGTVYYVRAYALTADGAVYYGPQYRFKTADACFVATASFGTLLHPGVRVLREFRDAFLATSDLGRMLVDRYYTLSPPVADLIGQSGALRATVRLLLLPLVGFSWLALQAGLVKALLLAGCVAVVAGRGTVRLRPRC